jgi:glycine/D-amino acid oxidase-like deaminating enzyme
MRLTRRQMLQAAAASAGFLSMPAVVTRAFAAESVPLRGGEILPDPDFSRLRRTEPYLVGIRPHRTGGVCLKLDDEVIASRHGSKFLIHNYGHGGAGITLSFGCAAVVADHVRSLKRYMRRPSVAVIGCGVIGLTVAAELRRRWPKLRLTV